MRLFHRCCLTWACHCGDAGAFKAVNGAIAQPADARVTEAFPKLAGIPHVALQSSGGPLAAAPGADRALNIGVVLSGGQAPGRQHSASLVHVDRLFPLSIKLPQSGTLHAALQSSVGPLAATPGADRALNIGVVLSGGQAPGEPR